jgi:glycosyltransferase involved in cell wall biosynthesis
MKIALVHDQLSEFGGAERVLMAMAEIWPDAPIYTAYSRRGPAMERFQHKDIRVSWMQPFARFASPLRFLAPMIWNSFDFSDYDVIIGSSSWYITKGFAKKGNAVEICYCHTPPRWLYGYPTSVNWQKYRLVRWYATVVGFFMRQYDFLAAQRVNYFIANSKETQKRIQKFYRRDSTLMYPPIDLPDVSKVKKENYYLFVSRPVGSKGLEFAVSAAKKLKIHLKVVGARGAGDANIEYLGYVPDERLAKLYAGAKAFLALATDEDFGMTPVEAMHFGTPVIAYEGGGYTESVVDGKTGIFFKKDLAAAIKKFETMHLKSEDCEAAAEKFSKKRFQQELKTFVLSHARSYT